MATTATAKAIVLVGAAVLAAGSGCSDRDYTYPFYDMELDTDTDTDTGADGDGDGDGDGDSDTDACDDSFVDDLGRCIRYVDWDGTATVCGTSWDDAFTNIQAGIDSAYAAAMILGSCEVWVASGTYRSYVSDFTDTIYLRSKVQVYGGFEGDETDLDQRDIEGNETILDGRDELALNSSYHVVMGADQGELDGFTITGGHANGPTPHHRGGGIYTNSTFTTIRNCTFRDNRAIEGGAAFLYDGSPEGNTRIERCLFEENHAERGGAMFVLNGFAEIADVEFLHNTSSDLGGAVYLKSVFGDCSPTFSDVVIDGNISQQDGGGVFIDNCDPALTDLKIVGNTAVRDGGGISGDHGGATITGSTIQGNAAWGSGGGVHAFDTTLVVVGSWFTENSAAENGGGLAIAWSDSSVEATVIAANTAGGDGGGIFVELDYPSFINTLVTGNRAARGAGAFNGNRAVATYVNTVFHGNRAAELAGGVYNAELSEVDLFNDIVYGDFGAEIYDETGSETEVAFCDVLGGSKGLHIIDADPMFEAPGAWTDPGTPDDPSDDTWTYGDYHLQAGSPCIDQADDDEKPPADADGHAWMDIADAGLPDVASDMGAYDYQM
jgi:hypothetical protein